MLFSRTISSHVLPDFTRWNMSQLLTTLDCVGSEVAIPLEGAIVEAGVLMDELLAVDVDIPVEVLLVLVTGAGAGSLFVLTQYEFPVARPLQSAAMLGF
ncbi:hypothetical protein VTL71DRAFT_3660 [Oculimacula yallundae]|uniref:Uncharacterized protein n=1 Tax=Oculimacula yallundae TaxID=86028 RepID=A0ABR4C602_9HELO